MISYFIFGGYFVSTPMLSTAAGWPGNLKQILTKYEHRGFVKAPHSCFVRHPTDKAAHIIGDIKSDVYEAASNLSNNVRSQSTFNMDWTSKGSKWWTHVPPSPAMSMKRKFANIVLYSGWSMWKYFAHRAGARHKEDSHAHHFDDIACLSLRHAN